MLFFVELQNRLDQYESDDHPIGVFTTITNARAAAVNAIEEYAKIHYGTNPEASVFAVKTNVPFAKFTRLVNYFKLENNMIVRYNVVKTNRFVGDTATTIDYNSPELVHLV